LEGPKEVELVSGHVGNGPSEDHRRENPTWADVVADEKDGDEDLGTMPALAPNALEKRELSFYRPYTRQCMEHVAHVEELHAPEQPLKIVPCLIHAFQASNKKVLHDLEKNVQP